MFTEDPEVNPKACDQWALGVSLHNLLTGQFPFRLGRFGQPRKKIDLSLVTHAQARDLLQKLLTADPSDRLSYQQILEHEFIQMYASEHMKPLSKLKRLGAN